MAPDGSWGPWWVLGDSDHYTIGDKIDKDLRRKHSGHKHFGRCNGQISPQKFPLGWVGGTLPNFMSHMQSFKPLYPALHQVSSKAASWGQGWPARCRPRVQARGGVQAGSSMPVSTLPGRGLWEEPKG